MQKFPQESEGCLRFKTTCIQTNMALFYLHTLSCNLMYLLKIYVIQLAASYAMPYNCKISHPLVLLILAY